MRFLKHVLHLPRSESGSSCQAGLEIRNPAYSGIPACPVKCEAKFTGAAKIFAFFSSKCGIFDLILIPAEAGNILERFQLCCIFLEMSLVLRISNPNFNHRFFRIANRGSQPKKGYTQMKIQSRKAGLKSRV